MIFNIQRFSTHDGAGIRTIVFFKGCRLHCPWCENPESQSFRQELTWDERKCIGCLDCMQAAKDGEVVAEKGRPAFHRRKIGDPGALASVCPTGALTVLGEETTVSQIVQEVQKDVAFYRKSGGGVTISGGEPYDQPAFLLELLNALGGIGVTVAIETTLSVPWSAIEPSLPGVEAFLVDIKHASAKKLRSATGGNLPLIVGNLRKLENLRARVTIRVPVIPGWNDSKPDMTDIVDLAASLENVREIHFLPFHTLGIGKYRLLGKEYRFLKEAGPAEDMKEWIDLARGKGLEASIGG